MESKDIMGYVQHYQRNIERAQDDEEKLLYCIGKLYKLPIKMEHLQETGIGKTVNALRKFDGEISVAAKALVTKWKAMVASQDEDKEVEKNENIVTANIIDIKSNGKTDNKKHNIDKLKNQDHDSSSSRHKHQEHRHRKERSEKHHKNQESAKSHRHKTECKEEPDSNKVLNEKHEKKSSEDQEKHRENRENSKRKSSSHHKTITTTSQQQKSSSSSSSRQHERSKSQRTETDQERKTHKNYKSSSSQEHSKASTSQDHSKSIKSPKNDTSNKKRSNRSEDVVDEASSSKKKIKLEEEDHNEHEKVVNDEGIDSSMGANFGDVLGMLNMPGSSKKSKKKMSNEPKTTYSLSVEKKQKLPDLLKSGNLEPLDPNIVLELPTISNNYRPMPLNQTVMDCVFNTNNAPKTQTRTLTDSEALQHGISSKTMRTKIYSGNRTGTVHQVPSLFDLCIRMLQKNIESLEYTGGVPFDVLKNVLDRATPQQLYMFEQYNPYIMEDSDILWQAHVQRKYRMAKRQEMESWREMFARCQEEEELRLNYLAEVIKLKEKKDAEPVRKTQLAFVDSLVKPPRNVARKQEQYGTKGKLVSTPASRVVALCSVTPNAGKPGDVRLRVAASTSRDTAQVHAPQRTKKAPLMAKTLQYMRGRHKR